MKVSPVLLALLAQVLSVSADVDLCCDDSRTAGDCPGQHRRRCCLPGTDPNHHHGCDRGQHGFIWGATLSYVFTERCGDQALGTYYCDAH
ncbi:hypothetical protein AC578_3181 [Pseudocercospora eumusae]|uniref:Hydrophobin n=1 Tax=Pseudocercospora eumusae TaxID=321146 RepID=A0A139GU10_9PEZI|nr:hypothetical protein AC578_3181 [Pseudocercospora eumusae]